MRIIVDYESSWHNSFLSGGDNEPLPKKGRTFVAASSNLNNPKKPESFMVSPISISTILGVLCRLIGDQRKLYQARGAPNYYFKDIESRISFEDKANKKVISNEVVYIRNMTGSYDREGYVGSIDLDHWLFKSGFSLELWSLLALKPKGIADFICENSEIINKDESAGSVNELKDLVLDPRFIIDAVSGLKSLSLSKLDEVEISDKVVESMLGELNSKENNFKLTELFPNMKKSFSDIDYIKSEKLDIRALYCSSLYLKLIRLADSNKAIRDQIKGNIKGFSVAGLTPKDFMSNFTKGKKRVYGNPYLKKEKIKGMGEVKSMLTKSSGQLEIFLDVDRERAEEISELIENAGVSSFFLGKKGLAYVSYISI